jgi:trk system potassium uptake protein TrkA
MAKNVVIVGGGKVGSAVAGLLIGSGHLVRLIEVRRDHVLELEERFTPGVVVGGSGTDTAVLERAGIHRADVAVAATGADETNLVVTAIARFAFSVERTIARVNDPRNAWMFGPEMGVDVALNQADLMAHLVAEEMSLGEMTTLVKLRRGRFSLVEQRVEPAAPADGRRIAQLEMPERCVLVLVVRDGELLIPYGDLVLAGGDEVLAVVHGTDAPALAAILGGG